MRAQTATIPATSMSPTQLESSLSEPALAVASNHSRSRLIENISRKVMAWTRWSAGERDKSNQGKEED
jgi:hypothetical protein